MQIQEVITVAKHSELNSVAVKNDTLAILSFINLGLIELYEEFILETDKVVVVSENKNTLISMPEDFMYPLKAYFIEIVNNKEVKRNVYSDKPSSKDKISFKNNKEIRVDEELLNKEIVIEYCVKPPKYTLDDMNKEVDIPDVLINCLLHYIGYRGHLGVRSDGQSENNSHYIRFMQSMKRVRDKGVISFKNTNEMPSRIFDRGFV